MKFIELVTGLEEKMGNHHFPVNPCAESLQELFDNSPVHAELVKQICRETYKNCGCRHLRDRIDAVSVNETLAPIRLKIMQSASTDIDTWHFLNDLCFCINDLFLREAAKTAQCNEVSRSQFSRSKKQEGADQDKNQQNSGEVVSIEGRRHLRWLKTSA